MRGLLTLLMFGLFVAGLAGTARADEAQVVVGAAYDPALDGDGTYRGFPSEFDGRYPKGMPPGEGWKVLSGDGWLATSKCIGSFESPECMMDTVLACEMWSNVRADREYREGDQVRFGKWHPICGKLEYDTTAKDTKFHWRHVFQNGQYVSYENIIYYKTKRFVLNAESVKDFRNLSHLTCTEYGFCKGDIVLVLLRLDCQSDPESEVKLEKPRGSILNEAPQGARIDHCKRSHQELALFTRQLPGEESWKFLRLFVPGRQGSGYRGWPYLEEVYYGMR